MPYRWPHDATVTRIALAVEDRGCRTCGRTLTVGAHRPRRWWTVTGPVHVVCQRAHGPARVCPAHTRTVRPDAETPLALPWGGRGWAGVCGLGQRRVARHWSVGSVRMRTCMPGVAKVTVKTPTPLAMVIVDGIVAPLSVLESSTVENNRGGGNRERRLDIRRRFGELHSRRSGPSTARLVGPRMKGAGKRCKVA
jgi:hypothetical protein